MSINTIGTPSFVRHSKRCCKCYTRTRKIPPIQAGGMPLLFYCNQLSLFFLLVFMIHVKPNFWTWHSCVKVIAIASNALDAFKSDAKKMVVALVDMERAFVPPQHFIRLVQRRSVLFKQISCGLAYFIKYAVMQV